MTEARRLHAGLLALTLMAAALVLAPPTVSPAAADGCDKTWADPGTGGMWEKAGVADATETQWSPAGVPEADDVVCLPDGDYQVVVFPGDQEAYDIAGLIMEEGAPAPPGTPRTILDLEADLTVTGSATLAGRVQVQWWSRLTAATVTQLSGDVDVQGVVETGTYTLDSGRLRGDGYGPEWEGLITGDVVNTGTGVLDPGHNEQGLLTVGGDYTQGGQGTFHVDYRTGAAPPTGGPGYGYDRLHVEGTATLGGTVSADLDVRPPPGERSVMVADLGITGAFDDGRGIPASWAVVTDGAGPLDTVDIVLADLLSDVRLSHPFLLDIAYLVTHEISTGYPDGTFRPTTSVSRQSMAAFLYRLAGEPPFTPPTPPTFSDVGESHPFRTEIEWLAAEDVTGGYPDGTFRPGAVVTRASMTAFLYRLVGSPSHLPPFDPTFPDVPLTHPFWDEVEWARGYGIASGFPDGTFRPGDPVSRQSMAAFIRRVLYAGFAPA
jgi:hypothetical protein